MRHLGPRFGLLISQMACFSGFFLIYCPAHILFSKPILGTGWSSVRPEGLGLDPSSMYWPDPVDLHLSPENFLTTPLGDGHQAESPPWPDSLWDFDGTDPQLIIPLGASPYHGENAMATQAHMVATRPIEQWLPHTAGLAKTAHLVETQPHHQLHRTNSNALASVLTTMTAASEHSDQQNINAIATTRALGDKPRIDTRLQRLVEPNMRPDTAAFRVTPQEQTYNLITPHSVGRREEQLG